MRRTIIYCLILASATLLACNREQSEPLPNDGKLDVSVGVGESTRGGTVTANLSEFGMFVDADLSTHDYANARWNLSDQHWTSHPVMFWGNTAPIEVLSYAPYDAARTIAGTNMFDMPIDQSEASLRAADILYQKRTVNPLTDLVDGKIPVTLYHKMCKVRVDITYTGAFGEDNASLSSISAFAIDGIRLGVRYSLANIESIGATGTTALVHPFCSAANSCYETIFAPQNATLKFSFTLDFAGDTFYPSFDLPARTFVSGNQYVIPITIDKSLIRVGEVSVSEWTHVSSVGDALEWDGEVPNAIDWTAATINLRTVDDLVRFRNIVNGTDADVAKRNFTGQKIVLKNDIVLSGEWTAIGSFSNSVFDGTFDGNGKHISGLSINNALNNQGLFGYVGTGGKVQNLTVEGSTRSTYTSGDDDAYLGGIVGYNNGTIEGCSFSGTVTSTSTSSTTFAGGIVGYNSGNVLICASLAGSGVSTDNYAGGTVGYNEGTLRGCYGAASISTLGSYKGGIVGRSSSGSYPAYCYYLSGLGATAVIGRNNTTPPNTGSFGNIQTLNGYVNSMNSAASASAYRFEVVDNGTYPKIVTR